ncbi:MULTISPECIES: hypothetical protein [Streptomyces]|uniref:hypothetical protein n=1 Tax=Streptomyces TaxID=1883 RepID=UPI0018E57EA8|nr:hypothetical protein [Streptomyces atratus]
MSDATGSVRTYRLFHGKRLAMGLRGEPGVLVSTSTLPPLPGAAPVTHPFATATFHVAECEGELGALLREASDLHAFLDAAERSGYAVEAVEDRTAPLPPAAGGSDAASEGVDRLIVVGRAHFAQLRTDPVLNVIELPDGLGVCLVHAVRGGGKIYVAPDESALFAGSAVDFETGLDAFRDGARTPLEKFDNNGSGTQG